MSNKMWGGRFAGGPGAVMEEINAVRAEYEARQRYKALLEK